MRSLLLICLAVVFISCGGKPGSDDNSSTKKIPRDQKDSVMANYENIMTVCDKKGAKEFFFLVDEENGFYTLYSSNGVDARTLEENGMDYSTYYFTNMTEGQYTLETDDSFTDDDGNTHTIEIRQISSSNFEVYDRKELTPGAYESIKVDEMVNCEFKE